MNSSLSTTPPREPKKSHTKTKLLYGLGINDADYMVAVNTAADADGRKKRAWTCPFYSAWRSMLARCYERPEKAYRPTYGACSVDSHWLEFSAFKSWMERQPWEGNQLDKDLLVPGNKVYSSATCLFLSADMNKFLLECGALRGKYPIGVCWHKRVRKFAAKCCNPFTRKQEHLGYFRCPKEAHVVWATKKLEHATALAVEQSDPRVSAALISRFTAKYEAAVAALT